MNLSSTRCQAHGGQCPGADGSVDRPDGAAADLGGFSRCESAEAALRMVSGRMGTSQRQPDAPRASGGFAEHPENIRSSHREWLSAHCTRRPSLVPSVTDDRLGLNMGSRCGASPRRWGPPSKLRTRRPFDEVGFHLVRSCRDRLTLQARTRQHAAVRGTVRRRLLHRARPTCDIHSQYLTRARSRVHGCEARTTGVTSMLQTKGGL